tara:strand:- start:18997 stop:19908 length:912 start_codon:yes stop_codon:yes gene_type:complete
MNYTQLRAFHAVATSGGLTKAAAMLNVTQPAITRQLKLLEKEHGVVLFHRRGHSLELTEAGHNLFSLSQRISRLMAEAADLITSEADLNTGNIRVGADSPYFIMDILAAFKSRYPGMNLTVSMLSAVELFRQLKEFEIDVAIVTAEHLDDEFFGIPFAKLEMGMLVGTGHDLYQKRDVYLRELADEPIILRESTSTTRRLYLRALRNASLEPNVVMELRNQDAVREAVASGLGLAPELMGGVPPDKRLHRLSIVDAPIFSSEFIVCRRDRFAIRKVMAFFELAIELGPFKENFDDILAAYGKS